MGFLLHATVRHFTRQPFSKAFAASNSNFPFALFSSTGGNHESSFQTKLGLGGNNWSRMEPAKYQSIVQAGLERGITVFEGGPEGGDRALAQAIQTARMDNKREEPITATFRIGYRTTRPAPAGMEASPIQRFSGDVGVERHSFHGPDQTLEAAPGEDALSKTKVNGETQLIEILHNITKEYILHELEESPLVQEPRNEGFGIQVVALLHNPEAQIMALRDVGQVSLHQRQAFLRDRLVEAFETLEQAVADQKISSYGVASNGLCLPAEHPLALSHHTILEAVEISMARRNASTCNLSVIQMPVNLLERTGLEIARDLRDKIQTLDQYQRLRDSPPLKIYAMRPLTCYPDRGAGIGHAFRLVDYFLPSGSIQQQGTDTEELPSHQWSHRMQGPPPIYNLALRRAMSHFDADSILEEQLKRELTAEERETLDGCKLLQSMLHDLDHGLAEIRSLGAHEEDLYQRIIPLIHDTFEQYDEDTGDVLEMFFKSYSLAVRYSIAHNTRILLQKGGDDGKGFQYGDIPDDEKLQEYALKYLLKEKAIDQVIVGASKMDQLDEMIRVCQQLDSA